MHNLTIACVDAEEVGFHNIIGYGDCGWFENLRHAIVEHIWRIYPLFMELFTWLNVGGKGGGVFV